MSAIFIVPTLISESVPDRMVPLIAKLIERNIAVNYRNVFKEAVTLLVKDRYIKSVSVESFGNSSIFPILEARGNKPHRKKYKDNYDEEDDNDYERRGRSYVDYKQQQYENDEERRHELQMRKLGNMDIELGTNLVNKEKEHALQMRKLEIELELKNVDIENQRKKLEKELELIDARNELAAKIQKEKNKSQAEEMRKKLISIDLDIKKKEKEAGLGEPTVSDKDLKPVFIKKDQIQLPIGVTFYNNISFEPTLVEFSVNESIFTVGIKCIPYTFKDMENVLSTILVYGEKGIIPAIKRIIKSKWNWIQKKIIPFTKAKNIYSGRPVKVGLKIWKLSPNVNDPGIVPTDDILFSPSFYDLASPNFIKKRLGDVSSSTTWATCVVFTVDDIEKANIDIDYFYKSYKRLANVGWGDIIVIDNNRENISYCSLSMLGCSSVPFSYLKKLIDLENVLDFTELSRFAKGPFSKVPIKTFIKGFKK